MADQAVMSEAIREAVAEVTRNAIRKWQRCKHKDQKANEDPG